MKYKFTFITFILFVLAGFTASAQTDTTTYRLVLKQELVNKAGKNVMGMTINGQIPGPTLRFNEGDYAVIYVKNEMDEETSIHWHGLLLPNFYDGVPYLNTPPIMPGETQKYEYPIRQSGTYWYHSHTMLQEQSGVYGSIVIHPRKKTIDYDKELVMVLSDWTNQKPQTVLRFLKRGSEFYTIKKGTATPLNRVIARGAFGAQLNFWKQRMEGADIADIYYDAFLVNGHQQINYPDFKLGEKIRLRIINGSASTSFWMTFGGGNPQLVSADGLNVEPVSKNKTFIAVAETYDFIVTVPEGNSIEFRSTAQDGSGYSSAIIGKGETLQAETVPMPDKIGMMQQMAKMNMRMGAPAAKLNPKKNEPHKMMKKWGMQMEGEMNHKNHHQDMDMSMEKDDSGMGMYSEYGYEYLKSTQKTSYSDTIPVKEILLNLTGNMNRYVWSMNGIPLSETDKIKITEGEITRITLNNLTMMHHPMHLHGHFFRVLNKNGEYSPLKHTVNVPPMKKVTIEFYGNEYGDWFFHCHILYHMMGGMARIFSYDTPRDPRLQGHPVKTLKHETNRYYSWGMVDIASHFSEINLVTSNIRNQFNLSAEYGWNEILEAEFSYQRYLHSYLSVFAGINVENEAENTDEMKPVAIAGIRYFTPYMFHLDVRLDHQLRPQIALEKELMIFPRTILFGEFEYQADFGLINELENEKTGQAVNYKDEITWNTGLEFLITKNFALNASYDNRFGFGGGLSILF
ncbi:multicopper oxidase domain-containing protein [Sunxiuqinia indica]|uniref:multicopper oxidase domain-containing protein n=1 Tax=Sunxiuqinia indica TaxID=2692584 RepID=UPI00135CBBF2|nr:multicopper oxidase domain-containing protein [Sunxiuqinia indica]